MAKELTKVFRARSQRSLLLTLPLHLGILAAGVVLPTAVLLAPNEAAAADDGAISGVVTNSKTKEKVKNALVVLQCTCLQGTRETQTNDGGLYAFKDLPPGTYTIQVLVGQADVSKVTTLPRGAKFRANFGVDPANEFRRKVIVKSTPVKQGTSVGREVSMEEFRNIPIGSSTSRDFTAVVESSATASYDSAGISLAGTTGAESKYTVEGANVNNPRFGTVGASIVQEFIEEVEIQEAGYEAEYGDASGGQVSARRISGTNKLRGIARFTYTPRLAKPRFILATDNALRAVEVPDYQLQGVVAMSGPIIKDRLFWSAGIAAFGGQGSLIQSFHHRVDKDASGGYEECPYENGAFDCVKGGDYIATEKFAEQKFKVGGVDLQFIGGLDWAITPKHRIKVTYQGNPGFVRRTYRRPVGDSLDPSSFGTNPNAAPLGGGSRIANGVVNEHFGWDRDNSSTVSLNYNGRVADDKLEIDANFNFSQFNSQEAWKVDNPDILTTTATQEQDSQGTNLFELLDRDNRLDLVPGVEDACNNANLPGLTCPVRQWLSGGAGQYSKGIDRRVVGNFALTHFFNGAGAHQLKYGAQVDHVESNNDARYTGRNDGDFYSNAHSPSLMGSCGSGGAGGEYCYDRGSDQYFIDTTSRVNNHRFIFVDTDNPDARTAVGYGRVRKEQGELRAIANPLGGGVRVDAWTSRVATQNYAFFLQDKWAILSNLFVTAGVRWEMQDMRDILGRRAVFIWDNVAPRIGINYDWTDEGRSRLFASYGWFYQPLPLQLNNRVFGGLVNVQRTYRNADCVGQSVIIDGESRDKYAGGQPTEYCTDFNAGTTQLTEGAVVPRLRGQYNQQFQMGYEQEVIEDLTLGVRWLHTDLGRAVEDISTNGGLNFIIANPGVGVDGDDIAKQKATCERLSDQLASTEMDDMNRSQIARDLQRCEFLADAFQKVGTLFNRPRRNFDAFTFELKKRFAKNWLLLGSYTYSRLVGNYDGFVDPITGAINLGASTQYDIPELVRNSFGPLSFNTPHRFKIDGFYSFDLQEAGRLTLGTSVRYQSGFPISLRAGNNRYPGLYPVYVVPRGAGGRVEANYSWNLSLSYAYPLPGDLELEFAIRWLNVTNAKAAYRVDEVYSYDDTRPVAGGDLSDVKHTKIQNAGNPTEFFQRTVLSPQGNFGVEAVFQTPTAAQFELQLRF
ncbi:MAG TPA: TonB-dependent receptor [Nannocystaceae bacterium]|nr:TonB-dependent receptor [Nannocystaceae bacterium]